MSSKKEKPVRSVTTRRQLLGSSLALTAVAGLGAMPARAQAGKTYKFRMQSIYTPGERGFTETLTTFVNRVNQMSEGRIEIQLFSGGTLVPAADTTTAVARGIIDMGASAASYLTGVESAPFAFQVPHGPRNAQDLMIVWESGLKDLAEAAYDRQGVKLLSMMMVGDVPLYSRKPIATLADFQGLRIRTNPVASIFTNELGAANVFIPGAEVYIGLSNGTVDAATWGTYSTMIDKKWYEVAKYVVQPPLVYAFLNDDITMNKAKFDELPDDLKEIVLSAARSATWELFLGNMMANKAAWKLMEEAGVQEVRLPAADLETMTEKAKVVWDDLASRGKDAYAGMTIVTDYMRSMGYTDYDISKRNITVKQ